MYNFKIRVKKYIPIWRVLDFNSIKVSGITIIAKNDSIGGLYKSKYITNIQGMFEYKYGSHRYPDLVPKSKEVVIEVSNFPRKPKLQTIKEDIITIEDIQTINPI